MVKKEQISIEYTTYSNYSELNQDDIDLIEEAKSNLSNAYAPYSNFQVSALVQMKNKQVFLGTNQENVAYPSGLCAERVAIFYAKSILPKEKISSIVIVSKGNFIDVNQVISPCGSCRQVIAEYENNQNEPIRFLLVASSGKTIEINSIENLLPFCFK